MSRHTQPTEKVVNDATMAAVYFRTLVAEQVPVIAAVSLTSAYIGASRIADNSERPPTEPWSDQ